MVFFNKGKSNQHLELLAVYDPYDRAAKAAVVTSSICAVVFRMDTFQCLAFGCTFCVSLYRLVDVCLFWFIETSPYTLSVFSLRSLVDRNRLHETYVEEWLGLDERILIFVSHVHYEHLPMRGRHPTLGHTLA